jgi:hypothetical protein
MTTSSRRMTSAIGTATPRATVKSRAATQPLIRDETPEAVSAPRIGMRIYFAGASGVIGSRLLPLLVDAIHDVNIPRNYR